MSDMPGLDAAGAASVADAMLRDGRPMIDVWRHAVAQLLDDYQSDLLHHGVDRAQRRLLDEPPLTSSPQVDAALAALAEHLSRRDGWETPDWARRPARYTRQWWFVTPLRGMHATALQQSPPSFRTRGVFITRDALVRV